MPTAPEHNWVEELAKFLRTQPQVSAVRIDPESHRVAIATLGQIDTHALEDKLAATIAAVETSLASRTPAVAPKGFSVREDGNATVVGRDHCATSEKLWQWRDVAWPTMRDGDHEHDHDHEHEHEHEHEGGHSHGHAHGHGEWRLLAKFAAVCGVAGVAGFAAEHLWPAEPWIARLCYIVGIIAGGWDAAVDSWENLKKREIDIHFLMLAVAIGAMFIGAWGEAVLLLFLFSASGAMEEFAMDRTQREVSALLKSAPKHATLVEADGTEREVPVESLAVGQRVLVRPGEAYPADGVVTKGKSASDESALTGEATPVEKHTGAEVFSGTINLWGAVEFEVTRLPSESTLQKIIRLIQTAQKLKAPSERFTDKFGTGYTYAVIGGSALMFLVWWLGFGLPAFANTEETRSAFYRAMTLMVVASPCALVLSIPSAILAAIAWGARHGVLFRGGAAIEKLAEITAVALDKTGTLTTGELAVVGVESFPTGREAEVLELAYALEARSQHPIARAIIRHAKTAGVKALELEEFQSLTGQGLKGKLAGTTLLLGRRELLEQGPLAEWAKNLPAADPELSEVWVIGKDVVGRVLLRDQIRRESRDVLDRLKAAGVRTVMLTGDRRHAAEAVAKELGVDEVRAGLSPEDKVNAIQEIRASGRRVAMVGDGVNDAPSLAAADVSVAMGARGSDAALEQAEVILMHDRIENFLAAQRLSRRARAIIRQNLAISLGVVIVMVISTAIGAVPLAVGVAAHEGSTLVVCINSLRLLFGRNR
ncbi:MAG: heavy metal translocating P-type ATPase [Opitutus sp.]|nr:heavy metal translocating P-type ATPase [Opitutus sp.]